jgi:hypothetical protein
VLYANALRLGAPISCNRVIKVNNEGKLGIGKKHKDERAFPGGNDKSDRH